MLKKVGIGIGVLVLVLVAAIMSRPSQYHIERSTTIEAPVDVVFGLVNEFKSWRLWSPWDKLDPNQKQEYSDPSAGQGAWSHWSGNDDVGEGKMTITEVVPNEKVTIALEFMRPFPSKSTVVYSFVAEGTGTKVTWGMDGTNDFMGKAFDLMMNMDAMLGKDFDEGLAKMKVAGEEAAKAAAAAKAAEEAAKAAEEAAKAAEGGAPAGDAAVPPAEAPAAAPVGQ